MKAESVAAPEEYWLYFDAPLTAALEDLDSFLRKIWLECCGHMSAFYVMRRELGKKRRLSEFSPGESLRYEYDFGQTTELSLAFLHESARPPQEEAVRLLARNQAAVYSCASCGADASLVCSECMWDKENPFYCPDCAKEDALHLDYILPVTNSPRNGICSYRGGEDRWALPKARKASFR
jgi:hypothetical protein